MSLETLLRDCTVKLSLPNQRGWGTGFFVAPGLILTCAHVVKALTAPGRVQVRWQQQVNFAEAEVVEQVPELDLALLQLLPETTNLTAGLPCVCLDEELQAGQEFYFFGYPDHDFDNGCPVTGSYEGLTGDVPPLIKFKLAQVRPGMSGSALLNRQTGKVCGMVKFTRDRTSDLGGGAIPASVILQGFPQLRQLQQDFHDQNQHWRDLLTQKAELKNFSSKGKSVLGNSLFKVSKTRVVCVFFFLTLSTTLIFRLTAQSPLNPPFGRSFYDDIEKVEVQTENVEFVNVEHLRFVTEDVRFTNIDDDRHGDSNLLKQTLEIRFTIYNNSEFEINISNFQVVVYKEYRSIFLSSRLRRIVNITPENPFIMQNIVYSVAPKDSEYFLLRYRNTVGNGIMSSADVVGVLVYYHSSSGDVGKLKSEKLLLLDFNPSEIVTFDESYILNRIKEVEISEVDEQQKEKKLEDLRSLLRDIVRHKNL